MTKIGLILFTLMFSHFVYAEEAIQNVDVNRLRIFSVLYTSRQALVGIFEPQSGRLNFAQCRIDGAQFEDCTVHPENWLDTGSLDRLHFLFQQNLQVAYRLKQMNATFPEMKTVFATGFEVGVLRGLGLNSLGIGAVFGLQQVYLNKQYKIIGPDGAGLSETAAARFDALFDMNPSKPQILPLDSGPREDLSFDQIASTVIYSLHRIQRPNPPF